MLSEVNKSAILIGHCWSILGPRCPKKLIKENISLHTYLQCITCIFKFCACKCMLLNQNVCVVLKNRTGHFVIFALLFLASTVFTEQDIFFTFKKL